MQAATDKDVQGRKWKVFLAAALVSASMGAAGPDGMMAKGNAEESVAERRRAEASKRKEMLSRAYAAAQVLNFTQLTPKIPLRALLWVVNVRTMPRKPLPAIYRPEVFLYLAFPRDCRQAADAVPMPLCRRENALAKGGVDAGNPDAAALETLTSQEAPPVNAAVSSQPSYMLLVGSVIGALYCALVLLMPMSFAVKVCRVRNMLMSEGMRRLRGRTGLWKRATKTGRPCLAPCWSASRRPPLTMR